MSDVKTLTHNPYADRGFDSRDEYLEDLAAENNLPPWYVRLISNALGENEDFDALVTELEDAAPEWSEAFGDLCDESEDW